MTPPAGGLDLYLSIPGLSPGALLTSEADLVSYSYDSASQRARPDAVVLARSVEDVRAVVRHCAREKIPFTARGAGTNLSGGCIPLRGGVVVSLARMDRILEIDTDRDLALVEPGVVNLNLQGELEKVGYFYAPDPASFRVCTLGGNVAENAGGPRCLKYGTTTNHVLALEVVMPDGSLEKFSASDAGYEMMSLITGSEGTLGVITKIWLKILPLPKELRTFLAGFDSIDAAVGCVSAIIARGILPRALEVMDKTTVEAVEAYIKAGYPKAEAVLLIELDGAETLDKDALEVERLCRGYGAGEFRCAKDPAEREKLWEGRRGSYAAMARLAPNVSVEDGVVPRDKLPEITRRIMAIARRHGLTTGLIFHAGDGNIHPNFAYDERNAEESARVKEAGHEILKACVELGGSLSGEHGIGLDKRDAMSWLFSAETLALFRRVKSVLDPDGMANPDKILPLAGDRKAGRPFIRPKGHPLSPMARRLVPLVLGAALKNRRMAVVGSGSKMKVPGDGFVKIDTAALDKVIEIDRKNFTMTVEAGISARALRSELAAQGLHARIPETGGTLGGLFASKVWGGLREDLLGMRLLLADGEVVELGGKVVKNVAGYDVPRLLLGSWGTLGIILELTMKVYAFPLEVPSGELAPVPFQAGPWQKRLKTAFDPKNLLNPWFFES